MLLDVQNLYKSYDGIVNVVDDVSFSIPEGSICGFLGPNGAGKTTTMRICSTLELPDSGDIFIDGFSVLSHPREARSKIGFMPDLFPIEPTIVVTEMLEFFGRSHGLWGPELKEMTNMVIEFTNLEPILPKQFGALSKGMKQRASLATILMHDPSLLILDEPAAGLDPRARIELRQLLQLLAERGKSILISSHILAELSELCDQVVVIEKGVMKGQGDVRKLLQETKEKGNFWLQTLADVEMVASFLSSQEHVEEVKHQNDIITFNYRGDLKAQSALIQSLCDNQFYPVRFAEQETNLEDIFMSLTEGQVQ
jgi:ABC-2 type transport system ATP-binding protein